MSNNRLQRIIKYARWTAVAIGLGHFVLMLFFLNGPELAPIVVYMVDFPIAALTTTSSTAMVFRHFRLLDTLSLDFVFSF